MVQGKNELLMESLIGFYNSNSKYNIGILRTIIEQKSILSLRLFDWFVTNYSRYQNVHYSIGDTIFNVHIDYKNQLRAFSKKQFDPFCRRERVYLNINPDTHGIIDYSKDCPKIIDNIIVSTVGQLNFFRWAIKCNVASYILKNHQEIEKDMTECSKQKKNEKKQYTVVKNEINGVLKWI